MAAAPPDQMEMVRMENLIQALIKEAAPVMLVMGEWVHIIAALQITIAPLVMKYMDMDREVAVPD